LEAVKAFTTLLSKETFINNAHSSIMRLSSRLIEMSIRDIDVNVRVNSLKALALLDKTGVLQDEDAEQRKKVVRVVFDQEPRVRRAVGEFVKGLLDEAVETLEQTWSSARPTKKKRAAKIIENDMEDYLRWKAFATMMVETYHELDIAKQTEPGTSSTAVSASMGRATAAVEALRGQVEGLSDWDGLVDYLLLDHSTHEDDMWLLEEEEEDFMIQILIACIRAAAVDGVSLMILSLVLPRLLTPQDETRDEQSKALIKVLPRLLAKHHADTGRMSGLLTIPSQMDLGLYLDMRMTSVSWPVLMTRALQLR
jgi:cohesin complex subunit SA-1/2